MQKSFYALSLKVSVQFLFMPKTFVQHKVDYEFYH